MVIVLKKVLASVMLVGLDLIVHLLSASTKAITANYLVQAMAVV